MPQPKAITLSQDPKGIVIEWDDGNKGTYPFEALRRSCPCAACKEDKELAHKVLPAEALRAADMFKVGHYALGFRWGDGHDSGIYTWDYLWRLRDVM